MSEEVGSGGREGKEERRQVGLGYLDWIASMAERAGR